MKDDLQSKIRNDFSKVVDAYSKYRRDYINKTYDLIYKFCPNRKSNVLDVGCGTGLVTNHLANFYDNVTGTDKSQEMLNVAKKTCPGNVSYIMANAEDLPFKDNSFDLVTVAAAYHWFDYDRAGKEIHRVLKPDGRLCVFWKYAPGNFSGYLPEFAIKNLHKFISDIPHANKESLSTGIFLRVGFSRVNIKKFDFDDVYSRQEILGYIQSHSTLNLLDDRQKEEYKKLNEESVSQYLINDEYTFKSNMEMLFIEK